MQDLSSIDFQCALYLPSTRPQVVLFALNIRSDPAPGWTPHPSLRVPFHVAHRDRIFVMTLWVAEEMGWKAFVVFLPLSTVYQCLDRALKENKREFSWKEWGPDGTRFIEAPSTHSPVWICFVSGMSYISAQERIPRGKHGIRILDFRPLALRKQQSDRESGEDAEVDEVTQTHDSPHTVDLRGNIFVEPVTTSLPFRERILEIPVTEKGLISIAMMNEDSIVIAYGVSSFSAYLGLARHRCWFFG